MKYEFIKVDEDTTKLKYKDKEFTIKRDVDLQKRVQDSIRKSKILMNKDLTSMGMTIKDLEIKKQDGNQTIVDNSNIIALEKEYEKETSMALYDELTQKYCGMSMGALMIDVGVDLDSTIECQKFGLELTSAFMGKDLKSPSEEKQSSI